MIKRGTLAVMCALFIVAVACAPGGGEQSPAEEAATGSEPGEDVELTVWSWRQEDVEQYEAMFAVYEEQNPGVKVEFKPFKNTEYNQILTTGLTGSTGPDVVQLKAYGGIQPHIDSRAILPLDEEIAGLEVFPDEVLAALSGRSDGRIYGVPFAIQTLQVIYNKEIFADLGLDVPQTWQEFHDVASALDDAGLIPVALAGGDAQVSVPVAAEVFGSARYGGSTFAEAVQAGEKDFTADEYVAALDLMAELEPYFSPDVTATTYDDARVQFVSGAAAMYPGGVWEVGFFRSQDPDLDIGIFDVPPGDGWASDTPLTPGFVDGGYGVAANSSNPGAAKKLVEWMATAEFGQMFADELNQISAVPGVQLSDPIQQQAADGFAEHGAPYLMLVDFRYGDPWGTDLVGDAVQKLWLGEDAEEVAASIQDGLSQWFTPQG